MFGLLQPTSLFAIAGITVPLLIHLWNIRRGKTLLIGSILLLEESATQRSRSLRFTDILLLIIRCLLIVLLAFLLAQPVWKKQLTVSNEKGWVMMEKQAIKEAYKNYRSTIDSLLKVGYQFHYFNKSFEPDKFEDAVKRATDTAAEKELPYWILLKGLNEQVPADLPVYLFTTNRLTRFAGTRPEIAMNLKWSTYTLNDTITKVLVKADKIMEDSIRIIAADSKPMVGFYNAETISFSGNSQYKVAVSNGKTIVSSGNSKVELDTSVLNIAIYTDGFAADAAYVKAAIDAIHQYTKRAIKVSGVTNSTDIKPGTDWLFWLSEKALPTQLPPQVFRYEKGKEQALNSWIIEAASVLVNQEPIHLSRFIEDTAERSHETIWKDGYGRTILGLEKEKSDVYHFYSRFNPEWGDLPWSSQFAEMIYHLLMRDFPEKNADLRMIDAAQLQPTVIKNRTAFDKEKFVETTDLSKVFWMAAFLFFCIERMISLTRKRTLYA